jgi:hypothetical protein
LTFESIDFCGLAHLTSFSSQVVDRPRYLQTIEEDKVFATDVCVAA